MWIRLRTLLLLLVLGLVAAFVTLNWSAFAAPTPLDLLVTRVEYPLGLVMLGVVGAVTALYVVFAIGVETRALWEARQQARELAGQRRLAESAESSRYAELRRFFEEELGTLRSTPPPGSDLSERLDRMETRLSRDIERAGNTLAAYVGELEDRLLRGAHLSGGPAAMATGGSRLASAPGGP
jgi:hypothetical protein